MSDGTDTESPSIRLDRLAYEALEVSKKARKHRKNLNGDTFYGNKLANLRTDATILFSELSSHPIGDTSALAELVETSFSADTAQKDRLAAVRELSHALRTKWKQSKVQSAAPGNEIFPLTIIAKTQRGYLTTIAKQMNGCAREGFYDACAVMMRRLVEISIIEAFEKHGIASKIKDAKGDYLQLTALVDRALEESAFTLSRNAKAALPKLKTIGHQSAHGRYFTAQEADVERVEQGVRVVLEEFLHHAGLA
jgi:hypothetical protein